MKKLLAAHSSFRKFLCVIALLTIGTTANATPIVDTSGNITHLDVSGTSYDVTWNFGAITPPAGAFDLFTGNAGFAATFMNAVLAAFTNAGYTGTAGQTYYGVDYAFNTGPFLMDVGAGFNLINSGHGNWAAFSNAGWGTVTTSVSEPTIIALFSLGMIGLGYSSRKNAA